MSPDFQPWPALLGGVLVGVSASAMLLVEGRVAGISGILSGAIFTRRAGDLGWRVAFLAGLALAGLGGALLAPETVAVDIDREPWMIVVAGLLVGVGVRVGNGCTSGHGVCGLSRLSPRSLASVMTFMGVGAIVAVTVGQLLRGAS